MSLAHRIKSEICSNRPFRQRRQRAMACGLLSFGGRFDRDAISIHTEHRKVARLYADSITDLVGISGSITVQEIRRGDRRSIFAVKVDSSADRAAVLLAFGRDADLEVWPVPDSPDEIPAFLSGAFLACGGISDPEKSYHLEFATQRKELCALLEQLLAGQIAAPKATVRRNDYLLYYKESEQIEDLLTLIGAPRSALELMEVKIVKDLRNKVNRATNCETANITRTVNTAVEQIEDIRLIEQSGGIGMLPEELQELARLRLSGADLSLRQLGEQLSPPISRSGVNHRLKRISEFAENLRAKGPQTE